VQLNEELRQVLDPLVEQARGSTVVVSPEADDLLAGRDEAEAEFLRGVLLALPDDPEAVLTSTPVLDLLIGGYLRQPALDPGALATLRDSLPIRDVNLDDEFELRVVDEDELARLVPSWAGQ
jgi:hypothetical protein